MGGGSGGGGSGHGVDVFEKKKSDEEEVFFCVGVSDFWAEWDNRYLFCNLSGTIFLGARKPAINPCRTLVHSYARVGYYQNKISNVTNCSS